MMKPSHLDPALLALMAGQGGVVSATQAMACGYTRQELSRLRSGRQPVLISLRRGVYALTTEYLAAAPADQHRMRLAALHIRLVGPAVLTHQSAAAEHVMELLEPDLSMMHVTREGRSGSRQEAGVQHHVAELPEHHVVRREGALDLATLARTAVDVARDTNRFECAVAAFDSALRMGVPREELEEVFARCRSWPG
ncbi:MAG TPA: type IV toxin-antitoxin system AbiEi family antitoxin domain-containing protein, partial [Actinomycetes bacterium]